MNDDLPDHHDLPGDHSPDHSPGHDDLPDHHDPGFPDSEPDHGYLGPDLDPHGELAEHHDVPGYDAEHAYVDAADVPDHTVQVSAYDAPVDHDEVPRLEVSITPADGLEWVDPDLLGDAAVPDVEVPRAPAAELLADLQAMGDGDETWESAAVSDDPAVRALAARWMP